MKYKFRKQKREISYIMCKKEENKDDEFYTLGKGGDLACFEQFLYGVQEENKEGIKGCTYQFIARNINKRILTPLVTVTNEGFDLLTDYINKRDS